MKSGFIFPILLNTKSAMVKFTTQIGRKVHSFAKDLIDGQAQHQQRDDVVPDVWALILLTFASVTAFLEGWKRIVTDLMGIPAAVTCVVLSAFGIIWCIHIITARDSRKDALVPAEFYNPSVYRFRFIVRQASKIGLFALLIISPALLGKATDEVWPLPKMIYGELLDPGHSPVPNINLRLINSDQDVTGLNSFSTDTDGFYQIETQSTVRRTAKLIASCPQGPLIELSLARGNQVKTRRADLDQSAVFFRHYIQCGPRK